MKNINIKDLNLNDCFPISFDENATFVDFIDNTWVFVVKDDFYSDEEEQLLKQQKANIDILLRYDVLVFLIEITDILDVSDFYFNALDNDPETFKNAEPISNYLILFLDQNNQIKVIRRGVFSKDDSTSIIKLCQQQIFTNCSEMEFNCNMEGIISSFEPFELQKYALIHCSL